jgi:hypothetical protein
MCFCTRVERLVVLEVLLILARRPVASRGTGRTAPALGETVRDDGKRAARPALVFGMR